MIRPGNHIRPVLTFVVDNSSPTISITSPSDNTTITNPGRNFTITANASDNYGIEYITAQLYYIVGVQTTRLVTNYSSSINGTFSAPNDGKFKLELYAYDYAGNSRYSVLSALAFNANPPKVTNLVIVGAVGGKQNQNYFSGPIAISGVAIDDTDLIEISYRFDTKTNWNRIADLSGTVTNFWEFSGSTNTTDFSNGLRTLMVRPVDNLEGFVDFTTNIYIDNSLPTCTFINPGGQYEAKGGDLPVTFRVSDNISLFKVMFFTNNNTTVMPAMTIAEGTKSKLIITNISLSSIPNGETNELVVMVIDRALNTNIYTNLIIVDNDTPSVIINNPSIDQYVSSNILITGSAFQVDGMGKVYTKILTADNAASNYTGVSSSNMSGTLNQTNIFTNVMIATQVPQGEHTLMIRALAAGGAYTEVPINVTVDYEVPQLSITSVTNGKKYYGTVSLKGTATDNFKVTNTQLYIESNGIRLATYNIKVSSGKWSTNWNSTTLPVGNVDFILVAEDLAHNSNFTTNSVIIAPYLTGLSKPSSWRGDTAFNVTGYNLGTGSTVTVNFDGDTANGTGNNTSLLADITVPASATSGYVSVTVNGIQSINSNWLDIWGVEEILPAGSFGNYVAFDFDDNDKLYIAISGSPSGGNPQGASNYLVVYDTASSMIETNILYSVDNGLNSGRQLYIQDIDVNGNVMAIAYTRDGRTLADGTFIAVLTNSGSKWIWLRETSITTTIIDAGDPLFDVDIDDNDNIHFVYTERGADKIVYAKSTDYGAVYNQIDIVTGLTLSVSYQDAQPGLDFDSAGNPHVTYYDETDFHLHHIAYNGSSWDEAEVADGLQINGPYSDIFIAPNDDIYVSYYNGDQGDLMFTVYDDSAGTWNRGLVDYSAITGLYTSIDSSDSGAIAISYFNNIYNAGYVAYDADGYGGTKSWKVMKIPAYSGMGSPYGASSTVHFDAVGNVVVGLNDGGNNYWLATYLE